MDIVSNLAAFDLLVLLIVGVTAVLGLVRGFIAEVASLAAWVAGFAAVRFFYRPVRAFLDASAIGETLSAIAAVIGPFLLALLTVKLIGALLSKTAKDSVIGPLDRLLGLGFGLVKGVLASGLLFLVITLGLKLVPGEEARPEWLAKAKTTPTLALVASAMVSYVGDVWREEAQGAEPGRAAGDDPHAGLPGFGRGTGGDGRDDDGPEPGYGARDRRSLDRLLDAQEKQTPSTPI
jgi:membrane protein required for colicin V production